jgi:proline iminopeptidase
MRPDLQSGQPAPREGYIPADNAQLYYRDVGQGPPIILLHGGPDFDHHYLLPDMDRLADAFRLIYYDQRGRGKSAANVRPEDVSIQSETDDLDRVRQYFGLESVAVLGHSWGGLLAMEYAIRHPRRVSRLILLNPSPASHDDAMFFRQERRAKFPDDMEMLRVLASRPGYAEGDHAAEAAYYRVHYRTTLRPPELLDRLMRHLRVGATPEGIRKARAIEDRLYAETWALSDYDLLPKLTRLSIPTLVIHGDYDFVPTACSAHIAQAISEAHLVVLKDCGHFSYMERPDQVRQELTDFFHVGLA